MVSLYCAFAWRHRAHISAHQFPSVLVGMLGSTIPVSIIGIRFAMAVDPFWKPEQYSKSAQTSVLASIVKRVPTVPIVGMLCGSTISGIVVAVSYALKEFS